MMGDIGDPVKRVEFEPLPEEAPIEVPLPEAPVKVPEPAHE